MASPPPVEDQARLLEDALAVVRQQTMLMRRCLETPGKLMDALKCRYGLNLYDGTQIDVSEHGLTITMQLHARFGAADEQPRPQAVL
jgi:hypothetical protein